MIHFQQFLKSNDLWRFGLQNGIGKRTVVLVVPYRLGGILALLAAVCRIRFWRGASLIPSSYNLYKMLLITTVLGIPWRRTIENVTTSTNVVKCHALGASHLITERDCRD